MNFFRKLSQILSKEEYRRNPVSQNLKLQQLTAISIGAINAEQTGYFCDSLSTGGRATEIKENLSEYYGIVDRDSAFETLNWLCLEGHRKYFDIIKKTILNKAESMGIIEAADIEHVQIYFSNLQAALPEFIEHVQIYFSNLQAALPELIQENILCSKADLSNSSIAAWDMGRLVLVTRCCFDVGYISEQEAWDYINRAYKVCKENYSSWEQLANGYLIGRAMWSGSNIALTGIIAIAKGLLQDEQSPWKECIF